MADGMRPGAGASGDCRGASRVAGKQRAIPVIPVAGSPGSPDRLPAVPRPWRAARRGHEGRPLSHCRMDPDCEAQNRLDQPPTARGSQAFHRHSRHWRCRHNRMPGLPPCLQRRQGGRVGHRAARPLARRSGVLCCQHFGCPDRQRPDDYLVRPPCRIVTAASLVVPLLFALTPSDLAK